MSRTASLLTVGAAGAVLLAVLMAASPPAAISQTAPGLWEISRQTGSASRRLCVADVASLAQIEHRGARCTRVVIRDLPTITEIHYTCTGGGFGRSTMKLITPRSLRVETQGIASGEPFNYVFQARRVGECGNSRAH